MLRQTNPRVISGLTGHTFRVSLIVVCSVLLSVGAQAAAHRPNPLCIHTFPRWADDSRDRDDDTRGDNDEIFALVGPTGRLRVAFNYSIVINAKCVDTITGQPCPLSGLPPASATYSGIAIDLGCQLALRLGVPVDFVPYSSQPAQTLGFYDGAWDVGFTYDPVTGLPAGMAAGHPHLLIELAFVVPAGSPYEHVADVPYDAVINVAAGTTGVILLGQLGYTNVNEVANGPTALSRVQFGEIAAVGRSIGVPFADTATNNARILPDNYGYANATMATADGSPHAIHYLSAFVEWAKKKGLIQRAINAVTPPLIGVQVPPPQKVGGVRRKREREFVPNLSCTIGDSWDPDTDRPSHAALRQLAPSDHILRIGVVTNNKAIASVRIYSGRTCHRYFLSLGAEARAAHRIPHA